MKPSVSENNTFKRSGIDASSFGAPSFDARAAVVNRTHRVVRERAQAMEAQKRRARDLVIPFLICSALLWMIGHSVLTVADDHLDGVVDSIVKMLIGDGGDAGSAFRIVVWFLPLSAVTAAIVLLRRARVPSRDDEVMR